MKISSFFSLPVAALLLSGVARAQTAPVGMVALVKGQVWLENGPKRAPIRVLKRLNSGEKLVCGPASGAVVVLFENGARFRLGANSRAQIGAQNVSGAQKLPSLAGPSGETVRLLGQGRVGAISARPASSFQRLAPDSPPFLPLQAPTFSWIPNAKAARATFTLFDGEDNAVWSVSTNQSSVAYPADGPPLLARRPYLWRLSHFGASGKPTPDTRWGWVTFLDETDAGNLSATLAQLDAESQTTTEETPLWLQVEAFRTYGVVNGALELLTGKLAKSPQSAAIKAEVLEGLSPFARVLAGRRVQLQAAP